MPEASQDPIEQIFSMCGRSVIVTGASRGIGWAIADGMARAGAMVLGLARSDTPEIPLSDNAEYQICDVVDDAEFRRHMNAFVARTGQLDVLVNAAGISVPGNGLDGFDRTLEVNLRGPFACALAASEAMRESARGSIINVTSLGAFRGLPDNPAYVASKGGLSQLTRALAVDLGAYGIRVNNLVPGYILTAMTAASHNAVSYTHLTLPTKRIV